MAPVWGTGTAHARQVKPLPKPWRAGTRSQLWVLSEGTFEAVLRDGTCKPCTHPAAQGPGRSPGSAHHHVETPIPRNGCEAPQ